MELLDRYLQAVKFWLPRGQRQDIAAELSENLQSEIEEKEAELGRPLSQSELEAILTRWGHPMLVAERYLPQQWLIGPVLFQIYKLVLTIVTSVFLGPWLLTWIGFLIFDPAYRTGHAIADTLLSFWLLVLHAIAAVTVIFVAIDRSQAASRAWERWEAKQLLDPRPARDPNAIPRSEAIAGVIVGLIVALWWLSLRGVSARHELEGAVRITFWPLLSQFYWPILLVQVAGLTMACVNLRRPWWTRRRALLRMLVEIAILAMVLLLVSMGSPVQVTATDLAPERAARLIDLVKWANLSWYITLAAIGIASLAGCIQAARRVVGRTPFRSWTMTALGAP